MSDGWLEEFELVPVPPYEILPPETSSESVKRELDDLLNSIHEHEVSLDSNYVRLGLAVHAAIKEDYWKEWGYESKGRFVLHVKSRIGRSSSQIYSYASVAARLSDQVSEQDLVGMGISKAYWLEKFVKQSGRRVPDSLLKQALLPTRRADQLKADVYAELHEKTERTGKWRDIGGAWWEDGEWEEYQQAFQLAGRIEPASEGSEWEILKQNLLKMAREFMSSNVDEFSS